VLWWWSITVCGRHGRSIPKGAIGKRRQSSTHPAEHQSQISTIGKRNLCENAPIRYFHWSPTIVRIDGLEMSATDTDNAKPSRPFSFRREVSFWSAWLFGTAVSTVGVISFIQAVFGVHLVPTYAHGLAVYREVVHSIFGWLYLPFVYFIEWAASWFHFSVHITIPGWWKDLATISFVTVMALVRMLFKENAGASLRVKLGIVILSLIAGLTLCGLILLFITIFWWRKLWFIETYPDSEWYPLRVYELSLIAIAIAAVVFFVTNAYQL
jgi:hypothetical protein